MNERIRALLALAGVGALIVALGSPSVFAQDPDAYGDGYATGEAGRVRYHEGGAAILRAPGSVETDRSDESVSNAPVFPGDRVVTGRDQRVEIQLAGGSLIRVDGDSEISFEALPRPYAKFRDNTVLGLSVGRIQIASTIGGDEEFRIDTPAGSIYLLGDGDFRIESGPSGLTRVVVRRGVAEAVGASGSVLVRGGTTTTLSAGSLPQTPGPVNTFAQDGFDRWVALRDDAYRRGERLAETTPSPDTLPYEVRPYAQELSSYGSWVQTPEYGWVWSPTGVATDWRPYWDGYWAWGPRGYFWVSYDPWGWAPYRYGRWAFYGGRWCWVPGSVFGGAWVSWSWGSAWIGWAPLGYWGGPVYVGGPVYHGWYHSNCWTFVHSHDVVHHDVRRVAVPVNRVGAEVRRNAVVVRAPDVSPRRLATSADARSAAARSAESDRTARVERVESERNDGLRLGRVDERIRARPDVQASARSGRAVPLPGRDAGRVPVRVDRGASAPMVRTGGRSDVGRAGDAKGVPAPTPYPRRIVEDPRRNQAPAAPQTPRAQSSRPGGEDRVRGLYDRMSGPRTPREVPPRGESARPAPPQAPSSPRTTPRTQASPQRAPSQRSTPTPRAQQSPRAAPSAPKASPRSGSSDRGRGSGKRSEGGKDSGRKR